MNHDLVVSKSVVINAAPSKVWNVLTNPDLIKEYLYGTETITDWKVGSEVIFQGEYQGQKYKDSGVVKESVSNQLISYTYWTGFSGLEDKPENYALVTCKLESTDNKTTTLTWTIKGFANEQGYEHSLKGMDAFLQQIKEIVER